MDEDLYGFKPAHKRDRGWLRVVAVILAMVVILVAALAVMTVAAYVATWLFIEIVTRL